MAEQRFEARVEGFIPAPREKVWKAFATSDGFANVYEGITVEGDWRVGGTVVWSGVWEGKEFRDEGAITVYDAPRLFSYTYFTSFWGVPRSPESEQHISNAFESVEGGTRVVITQTNIATAESRDHSAKNWKDILDRVALSLRS